MNRTVRSQAIEPGSAPLEEIEIRVLPGKRFIFSESKRDADSIGPGERATGFVDRTGSEPVVIFPKFGDIRVKFSTIEDRWGKEIIDAWRIDGNEREELF